MLHLVSCSPIVTCRQRRQRRQQPRTHCCMCTRCLSWAHHGRHETGVREPCWRKRMQIVRLPEGQFPPQDQELQERLPVEAIAEQVNAVLRAHGLEAQLTSFSVMHRRFANCTCAEPSVVVSLQGFGRAMSRVEVECYDPCVKLGCSSQEPQH